MNDSTFWNNTVPRLMSLYANLVFAVLWVGFAIALVVNREWLDLLWNWVGSLPAAPRIIVWLVFLPVMVGLWVWESSWPTFGRLLGLAGIVGWTLLAVSGIIKAFKN